MNAMGPGNGEVPEVVEVLAEAFFDYPVMRWVLGADAPYPERLSRFITLFVRARAARGGPMLAVRDAGGRAIGVATVTRPIEPPLPDDVAEWREAEWRALGAETRERYGRFAVSSDPFEPAEPHHHLNMIGVRRTHRGTGAARALLEAVHALAAADPGSNGVSLTTEHPPNVTLYERFGYRVLGWTRIADELESWVLYRRNGAA